jgi:hypothetical protein
MRNIFETIDSLAASGITLNMEADKIRVFPKTLVTAEVRLVIRTYRAELVSALVMIDPANDSTDCPPVAARMFWAKHQSTLLANGWTSSEFWKRYPQPGVGWVRVWSDPSWDLSLQPGGVIAFTRSRHGRAVTQRATPPAKQSGYCAFLPSSDTATKRLGGNEYSDPCLDKTPNLKHSARGNQ